MNMPDPAGGNEERGAFDVGDFAEELAAAPDNHQLGTSLWHENDHVRVFEVRLEPGERGAFHVHDRTYFWTVVEPGRGLQRFADGSRPHGPFQYPEGCVVFASFRGASAQHRYQGSPAGDI